MLVHHRITSMKFLEILLLPRASQDTQHEVIRSIATPLWHHRINERLKVFGLSADHVRFWPNRSAMLRRCLHVVWSVMLTDDNVAQVRSYTAFAVVYP